MSLARGRYGIEYNPRQVEKDSPGFGWLVVVVIVIALVSLTWTLVGRFRARSSDPAVAEPEPAPAPAVAAPAVPQPAKAEEPVMPPLEPKVTSSLPKRPVKLRNLLMRLEEAEKLRDVEMAVSTIETIRSLPGSPAADLDDSLARRLGGLNMKRLFVLRSAQWVKEITVKRGDSVSRIAFENGSTSASLEKLNGGRMDKIVVGRKLYVMNHPRFNLVIHRRTRTADLALNGKFFKRYDLEGEVKAVEGAYELSERKRQFWTTIGARFKEADRAELEMLLPTGTPVLISEM